QTHRLLASKRDAVRPRLECGARCGDAQWWGPAGAGNGTLHRVGVGVQNRQRRRGGYAGNKGESREPAGLDFRVQRLDLNPSYYRGLIQDLMIERTVIRDLNKTMTQARDVGRPLDLPEELEQAASRIREANRMGARAPQNLRDAWPDFQARLQAYRGREFLGLRTGLAKLDERTLGPRGLILLGAMPTVRH